MMQGNIRNITPDTSPELEERPHKKDLYEHDARRIIEMRRKLTSTRRLSLKREDESPLTLPVTRSRSPIRRTTTAESNINEQGLMTKRGHASSTPSGTRAPNPAFRAILTMMDDTNLTEVTIPRLSTPTGARSRSPAIALRCPLMTRQLPRTAKDCRGQSNKELFHQPERGRYETGHRSCSSTYLFLL